MVRSSGGRSFQRRGAEMDMALSIYLSIYGIYIAPLQGNYSEALPARLGWRTRDKK